MASLKERGKQLKSDLPLILRCLKDDQTPWYAKALAGSTVAYALSPIDLIPDFSPVLGYLDDLVILPLLVWLTLRCIPREVFDRCRKAAESGWEPKRRWMFAIPIILIWLAVLWLVIRTVWKL